MTYYIIYIIYIYYIAYYVIANFFFCMTNTMYVTIANTQNVEYTLFLVKKDLVFSKDVNFLFVMILNNIIYP